MYTVCVYIYGHSVSAIVCARARHPRVFRPSPQTKQLSPTPLAALHCLVGQSFCRPISISISLYMYVCTYIYIYI